MNTSYLQFYISNWTPPDIWHGCIAADCSQELTMVMGENNEIYWTQGKAIAQAGHSADGQGGAHHGAQATPPWIARARENHAPQGFGLFPPVDRETTAA